MYAIGCGTAKELDYSSIDEAHGVQPAIWLSTLLILRTDATHRHDVDMTSVAVPLTFRSITHGDPMGAKDAKETIGNIKSCRAVVLGTNTWTRGSSFQVLGWRLTWCG